MKKVIFLLLGLTTLVGCSQSGNAAEYGSELDTVTSKILNNAAEVEVLLNQYSTVWSYSIESNAAIPVDEMVAVTGFEEKKIREIFEINAAGNIPNDFSINVNSLVMYLEDSGRLDEIKTSSEEIKNDMSEINDPSDEYSDAFNELLDLYTYSEEFTEMVLSPDGSLQSFNENKARLAKDIADSQSRIEVLKPNDN